VKKFLFFLIFVLCFSTSVQATIKEQIIQNLKITKNMSFNFEQIIDEKKDKGNCIVQYPKKIYCFYDNKNKKIIVSNGRSLVIKNKTSNQSYIYPLKKTPLNLILDKKFLIDEISKLKPRIIDNEYINFTIEKKNYKINLFFNNRTLNLIGWQTEDIYQNLVVTFIDKIEINKNINQNIFKLPKLD
jgi:outer membrane lipoprotein-sorting protein